MYSRLRHPSFSDEQIVFWGIDQLVLAWFGRLHIVASFHLFLHHQHPRKMEFHCEFPCIHNKNKSIITFPCIHWSHMHFGDLANLQWFWNPSMLWRDELDFFWSSNKSGSVSLVAGQLWKTLHRAKRLDLAPEKPQNYGLTSMTFLVPKENPVFVAS